MATLNLTPDTPLTRLANDWYQRAIADKLTSTDFDRWMMMYPNALAEANPEEFQALIDTDCAVEAALH